MPDATAVAELFHSQPPRFFFKPAKQMLLWCSLHGDTDEELRPVARP